MARRMRRRRTRKEQKKRFQRFITGLLIVLVGGLAYHYWPTPEGGSIAKNPEPRPKSKRRGGTGQTIIPLSRSEKRDISPATPKPKPELPSSGIRWLQVGEEAFTNKHLVKARSAISKAIDAGLEESAYAHARALINLINKDLVFSPAVHKGDPISTRYVVKAGQTLAKIAKQWNIPYELLLRVNRIADPRRLQIGQTIKVVKGPFHVWVDKNRFFLAVMSQPSADGPNLYIKFYRVGLGEHGSTPTGLWQVRPESKLKNPTWFDTRGGRVVAADDPQNPLGERWIGFDGISGQAKGQSGYGIHGTIEPETIGKNASQGCIRLLPADVEELYDLLVEKKSTVQIVSR